MPSCGRCRQAIARRELENGARTSGDLRQRRELHQVELWREAHHAERQRLVRPLINVGLSGAEGAGEEAHRWGAPEDEDHTSRIEPDTPPATEAVTTEADVEVDEAKIPKRPHDPTKPTQKKIDEHLPLH